MLKSPVVKFPPGTRVRIADDLASSMKHFPAGRFATVIHTYAEAYGGSDVESYCLHVDGVGRVSWYYENQLTLADDYIRSEVAAMDWPEYI